MLAIVCESWLLNKLYVKKATYLSRIFLWCKTVCCPCNIYIHTYINIFIYIHIYIHISWSGAEDRLALHYVDQVLWSKFFLSSAGPTIKCLNNFLNNNCTELSCPFATNHPALPDIMFTFSYIQAFFTTTCHKWKFTWFFLP